MRQYGLRLFSVLLISLCAMSLSSGPQKKEPPAAPKKLEAILQGCAEYCARLESSVLNFVCVETLHEEIFRPKLKKVALGEGFIGRTYSSGLGEYYQLMGNDKIAENEFVYDYQLIRGRDGKTEERLTLLRENGEERQEKNAELKTFGFSFKNIVFGPVVLLSKEWQPKHNYEIIGEEKIQGGKAIIIKVTPKPGEWLGYLYGTVWVNPADSSVLRIAWSQESLANFRRLEQSAMNRRFKPDIVLTGESGVDKNGLKFPSRFTVDESYICNFGNASETKFCLYKLDVVFGDYRFFTVETEVKY